MRSERANEQQRHGEWPMTRPSEAANDESFGEMFSLTERTQIMNPSSPQPPIKEFRIGAVSCAVWRDEVEQDGRMQVRHSFKLKKRYFKDGSWQDSQTYFPDDVFKAIIVFQQAYEFAMLHEKEQNGEPVAA